MDIINYVEIQKANSKIDAMNPVATSRDIGKALTVKTIDANGKPTSWEYNDSWKIHEDVIYQTGNLNNYYRYESETNSIAEATYSNFTGRKIEVEDWMNSVSFVVISTTGFGAATIYCAFTDSNDEYISKSPVAVGEYNISIPSNAKYIYLCYYGSSYVEGYTISENHDNDVYNIGNESGYYRYISETNTIEETASESFTRSKIVVEDWMNSVSFVVKSTTGFAATTIFCAFTDSEDSFISRSDLLVGSYNITIPENAKYIYLCFYGRTYIDKYTIISKTSDKRNSKYYGMNAVAFGTSLTYRALTTYGYLQYLPDLCGAIFDNQGIGSSYILGDGGNLDMLAAIKAYQGYANKRICIIEGFVNDWYGNKTLGTWKDATETTVCGCVRSALNYVLSQNAKITIFLVLDPYGRNSNNLNCSSTAVNGSGLTQFEYYEEIAKVAESLGIHAIKEYAGSQISENTPQYLVDNIHPTALGAKQSANYIWSEMQRHYPNVIA